MMFIGRRPNLGLSAVLAASATIFCLALNGITKAQDDPPPPPPITLGPVADFVLLSDAGPASLGNHTLISGSIGSTYSDLAIGDAQTKITGNAIATEFELAPRPRRLPC